MNTRHPSIDDSPCDVLLAYPAERINVFSYMAPLGLAGIAAVLEQRGYGVRAVDFAHYTRDFRRDLVKWKPAVVGIGGTTSTRKGSFLTARLVKETLPDTVVVYGGVHATFTAKDTLDNVPWIDYVIKGEGELSFLALCDTLTGAAAVPREKIPGLAYRTGGGIVENPAVRIDDLDALPLPARHLFPAPFKLTIDFVNVKADCIVTSRGCPACCDFCSASRMFPGGVRYRSMDHVAAEIEAIRARRPVGGLKLFDSTFTADPEHVRRFCRMIAPRGLVWECEIRADGLVDEALLADMKRAGCCYVNMGLETVSPRLLHQSGKNISVARAEAVLDSCKKLGILTKVFFIFGHPGETYRECIEDIRYMKSHKDTIDFYATTVGMRIYPGTPLERKLRRQRGYTDGFSWARYRPPWKNLPLLEFGDVRILFQPQQGLSHFLRIILRLVVQGTVLSREYIVRFVIIQGGVKTAALITAACRHATHRVRRGAGRGMHRIAHAFRVRANA
ncbi:MAG: B12-binding domain-containing radical SAM protein [Chitinispirillaceae bacterium]|nr:B12-binding domain-containing radical SAM protein [Chitinispirillaceae bacterium]